MVLRARSRHQVLAACLVVTSLVLGSACGGPSDPGDAVASRPADAPPTSGTPSGAVALEDASTPIVVDGEQLASIRPPLGFAMAPSGVRTSRSTYVADPALAAQLASERQEIMRSETDPAQKADLDRRTQAASVEATQHSFRLETTSPSAPGALSDAIDVTLTEGDVYAPQALDVMAQSFASSDAGASATHTDVDGTAALLVSDPTSPFGSVLVWQPRPGLSVLIAGRSSDPSLVRAVARGMTFG